MLCSKALPLYYHVSLLNRGYNWSIWFDCTFFFSAQYPDALFFRSPFSFVCKLFYYFIRFYELLCLFHCLLVSYRVKMILNVKGLTDWLIDRSSLPINELWVGEQSPPLRMSCCAKTVADFMGILLGKDIAANVGRIKERPLMLPPPPLLTSEN